jgi:GxxExxY protein
MKDVNSLIKEVISASIYVHKELGPGLLESVYEICLCKEFNKRGIFYKRQQVVHVVYEGVTLEEYFKLDLAVDNRLILEIKAVEFILPVHEAQLITYLKLSGIETGLILNFNTVLMKEGIRRLFRSKQGSAGIS